MTLVMALVFGAIALRVSGIAFSMVTLAFAQAFFYLIRTTPTDSPAATTAWP